MRKAFPLLASLLAVAACTAASDDAADSAAGRDSVSAPAVNPSAAGGSTAGLVKDSTRATAAMRDSAGRNIGTLTLTEAAGGITVAGQLTGLRPGAHGIHIHLVGQCQPPFESAGPHWNPTNRQHGLQNPGGPHFGDLPNITATVDSAFNVQSKTAGGTLRGTNGLMDADGAAVVIHADADDDRSEPAGNSGARIACGVISGS